MEPSELFGGVVDMRDQSASGRDLQAFFQASYSRLLGPLALIAGDHADAEDALQEAFVRLVPRWSKVSRYDRPEAWVRRVALRILSNRRRDRARQVAASRSAAMVATSSAQRADSALDELSHLPLAHRQVIVLHYVLDLPVEDIAVELDVPVGTVKSRLARARAALAAHLRAEESNHE
jgi:RNA polymerase sigma-70 factor (ECF subfamily)